MTKIWRFIMLNELSRNWRGSEQAASANDRATAGQGMDAVCLKQHGWRYFAHVNGVLLR